MGPRKGRKSGFQKCSKFEPKVPNGFQKVPKSSKHRQARLGEGKVDRVGRNEIYEMKARLTLRTRKLSKNPLLKRKQMVRR